MKNSLLNLSMIILISSAVVGCGKEFLEKEPTEFISGKQIKEASRLNPDLQNANIAGVYSFLYTQGVGGTGGHDDFGQRGIDIYSDMLCADMTMHRNVYSWYRNLLQLVATTDFTASPNYVVWRYYYRVIRGANTVIDGLGGNDITPENEKSKFFMGQAKAMRAYGYFFLANFFSKEYNPSEPILPIYTNSTDLDNKGLSTTKEVFDLIIKDLEEAISLLDKFKRSAKNEVNKQVAAGLLAYAYLTTGDYAKSAALSKSIIDSGNFKLMDKKEVLESGFNNISISGWMWGTDLTTDMGIDLASWWGKCDIFTFSYAGFGDAKVMDQQLFDKIRDDDVRKKQFLNAPGEPFHLTPYRKFYHSERKLNGQRPTTTDYFYMRIAEMYLINAEANSRNGNEVEAKASLKTLLGERIPDTAYIDNLSGQALLDEIYLQTRIELWGEGRSYLAMKRNKATVTKGSNHLYLTGTSYPYNDEKLTFEIPQAEIQDNPLITK